MSGLSARLWLAATIVVPAVPLATAGDAPRPQPLKVHLEEVAESAVRGFPVEDVEAALRAELRGKKSIVLVPTAEEAALVLRVTECVGWGEKHRISEVDERNIAVNPVTRSGRAKNKGGEGMYGVRTEYRTQVVLVVRATWSDHFEDLQAGDDDRNLKSAADTVAGELDRLAKRGLGRH
jgi:hypothetical protein